MIKNNQAIPPCIMINGFKSKIIITVSICILVLQSLYLNTPPTQIISQDNQDRIPDLFEPEAEKSEQDVSQSNTNSTLLQLDTVYNMTNELRIFGNANLGTYATAGSGTEGDPYILENYNVTSDGSNEALYLSGITAHTVIRNNIFDHQDNGNEAVFLYNSQNIVFENNTIKNSKVGIYDSSGSNNIIRDQEFVNIDGLSSKIIQFYRTTGNLIENLEFTNTADDGIYLADAVETIVKNIAVSSGKNSIEITRSGIGYGENNLVYNSSFSSTTSEAIMDWGYNNTFANNSFTSTNVGIFVFQGDNSIIVNNTFFEASTAIQLGSSSNVVNATSISFNTIKNGTRGIFVLNANVQYASVFNNTLINNTYGIDWETTSAGRFNNISYNFLVTNNQGMSFADYTGVNATFNYIRNSQSFGVLISSTEDLWINNNTIATSDSYGLYVAGGTPVTPSTIIFNDFMDNGGISSQVIDFSGDHTIENNFYSDHINTDVDEDGYADTEYDFDNSGTYTDPAPLATFGVPYSYVDTTPPVFVSTNSTNEYVMYPTTGNILVWNVTDENPSIYTITKDGVPLSGHNSNSWTSPTSIVVSIDGLSLGDFVYVATFTDTEDNEDSFIITVYVRDYNAPVITEDLIAPDFYAYGELTILTWTATDVLPSNHSMWINEQLVIDEQPWISGHQYVVDVSDFSVQLHNITILLRDQSNNYRTQYYYFVIQDEDDPVIHEKPASNISFLLSTTSYLVTYNATDNYNTSHYQIWINDIQIGANNQWNNATDINLDLVSYLSAKGTYNFTIIFYDDTGRHARHQINLTYGDLNTPMLTSTPVASSTVEYGYDGDELLISATDTNPNRFFIFLDSVMLTNVTWSSGEFFSYTIPAGLALGNHNLTFYFTDVENAISFEVSITVEDTLNPVLSSPPSDISYISETTGHTILWLFTDFSAATYTIIVDGSSTILDASWNSGEAISYDIDGMALGVHNVTIIVYDSQGHMITDEVIVTVTDPNAPFIESTSTPTDNMVDEGDDSQILSWTITDSNPFTYYLFLNGTQVAIDSWLSGIPVSYDMIGLTIGTYNFTILITDISGNKVVDTIFIFVVDVISPLIEDEIDPSIELGSSIELDWVVYDLHPDIYKIYLNDNLVGINAWDGSTIIYTFEPSSIGEYNITLIILDLSGNHNRDVVIATVVDTILPQLTSPSDLNLTINTVSGLNWVVADESSGTYIVYQDGSELTTGTWTPGETLSVVFNLSIAGLYNFTIIVTDTSGNTATDQVSVQVYEDITETTTTTTSSSETSSTTTTPTSTPLSSMTTIFSTPSTTTTSTTASSTIAGSDTTSPTSSNQESSTSNRSTTEDSPAFGWIIGFGILLLIPLLHRKISN